MLIHPWDAPIEDDEWRQWLADTDRFGLLAVASREQGAAPLLVPTHFALAGDLIVLHLARPNPVWPHVEVATEVRLAVIGDYAYVPSTWRAKDGQSIESGVPTSYYATVQFVCRPTVVDDPQAKVEILRTQFADQQPEGGHAQVAVDAEPYGAMLSGIRGLHLDILQVQAKFKFDDQKSVAHREQVAAHLVQRGTGLDRGVALQQRRRLAALGEWTKKPSRS